MNPPERYIFLAGAPDVEALSWDEQGLLSRFQAPLQRFLGNQATNSVQTPTPTPTGPLAKWRSVRFDVSNPQVVFDDNPPTQFLSVDHSIGGSENLEHLRFLEHSIALLDDLDSSQIVPTTAGDTPNGDSDLQTTFLSFSSTNFTDASVHMSNGSFLSGARTQKEVDLDNLKMPTTITDLKRIPGADHIFRVQPQTITVNLLVGVITVSPARTVRLRRRDAEMDIVEVIVGDETRAGFSISFWVVPVESQQKPPDDLRDPLRHLRSGDVVLLQNVALSCFKGSVYGESLSKCFARNSTSVITLETECLQKHPALELKLRAAQEWTSDFVGTAKKLSTFVDNGRTAKKRRVDELPPDTQD